MSKRYVGLTCIAVVACFVEAGSQDLGSTPQILLNTGFENGVESKATDWGIWPPMGKHGGVTSRRDAEVKHAGKHSGRLRVTNEDFGGVCTWHHRALPVQPGQEILLSFWIKAQDVSGSTVCDVQLRDGPTKIVGSKSTPTWKGSFDWKRVVHRFTIPSGVDHFCVVPLLRGTGTVWFDDVIAYATPTAGAARISVPPTIDGKLTEECWAATKALSGFALADGSTTAKQQTWVWATFDDEHLYFAFRCEKRPGDGLRKTVTEHDGAVWQDDDVELFLNPQGDWDDYYQFVVNPLGTRYESHRTDHSWNIDWIAATAETSTEWTAEISIPVAQLPIDLTVGSDWCVNFCRANKAGKEVSAWSCPFGGFHSPARFGRLRCVDLDYRVFYVRDAAARLRRVRSSYQAAIAGLTPSAAPADIAAPYHERVPRIEQTLAALEDLLTRPAEATPEQWQSIRPRLTQLAADIEALRAASLRLRVFAAWHKSESQAPRFGLTAASSLTKVFKDGRGLDGPVTKQVELWAARNEYEAAQFLALSLTDSDLLGCRAETGELSGPGGATIGSENLRLSLVGYITTGKPKYKTSHVGDWPDPLLPNAPFTLQPGQTQPLWLRVYVPPGTPAGDYRGKLSVTQAQDTLALPILVHVFDFDLPRQQHLATPFGCSPKELSQWYTGSADYEKHLPPEVFTRWNNFLLDYRITPTSVGQSYIHVDYDADGTPVFDYSITDQCIAAVADRLPPKGVNMASIGHFGWRAAKGATLSYSKEDVHSGERASIIKWPKTRSWSSLSCHVEGKLLAERGCRAFRFWVRALDASRKNERITAFVNAFPNRWITSFPIGPTEWHEVRLPIGQYRHNQTGQTLGLAELAAASNFQFVISKKNRVLEYAVDDIVAECEGGDVVIDDFELTREMAKLQARVGSHLRHWREKGWFEQGHVYGWDEARPSEYEQVLVAYRRALATDPLAEIMQTYATNRTPRKLIGAVRTWCVNTSNYDAGFLEERRAAGDNIWLYVCCGPLPPHANFFIDQPAIDHRILFWQTWQRKCSGFLYWEVNYWHGMLPQSTDAQQWPDTDSWNCTKLATYRTFKVNGDGWLVYPGRDWTPLPSVRLEIIRDGIEDYEYLYLLRELAPDSDLLQVGSDISRDFTHYCADPEVIEQRRLAIAKAIEALR